MMNFFPTLSRLLVEFQAFQIRLHWHTALLLPPALSPLDQTSLVWLPPTICRTRCFLPYLPLQHSPFHQITNPTVRPTSQVFISKDATSTHLPARISRAKSEMTPTADSTQDPTKPVVIIFYNILFLQASTAKSNTTAQYLLGVEAVALSQEL
jgi:hypothetical protein